MSERQQRVVLNGKNSDWRHISAGVPQGSVLGPLFFLVYINDLVDNISSDAELFADDTSLFDEKTSRRFNRKSADCNNSPDPCTI